MFATFYKYYIENLLCEKYNVHEMTNSAQIWSYENRYN